jgi:hypothetical protein
LKGRPRLEKKSSGVGGNADDWREQAYKHLTIEEVSRYMKIYYIYIGIDRYIHT